MADTNARANAFTPNSLPANYDRFLAPYLFEPWADVLLDAVDPGAGAAVLDVASGTGVVARAVARRVGRGGRVLAADISPAMVAFIAAHPAEDGAAPIETTVAPATQLGRDDGEFDLVLCQQGMPFFPDRAGAVREFRRVLRRGGTVGIAVWTPDHELVPFGPINQAIRDAGGVEPFERAWDRASYTLSGADVGALLHDAGFTSVESREVELTTRWPSVDSLIAAAAGTPFGPVLNALDQDVRERARAQMATRFAEFVHGGVVEVPTYSVIATARA